MVAVSFHRPVMMMNLVQYASSLLGLVVLLAWFTIWYYRVTPTRKIAIPGVSFAYKLAMFGSMGIVALAACYPLAITRLSYLDSGVSFRVLVATTVEAMILLFCVEVLLYGIARTYYLRLKQPRDVLCDPHWVKAHECVCDVVEVAPRELTTTDTSHTTPNS